ncbi:hypothetical protein HDV02_000106 [Globomyces sp. JEL0801]|nr:hypothetical protein HDV02_000106 [Globomyces sp. JEL0801]
MGNFESESAVLIAVIRSYLESVNCNFSNQINKSELEFAYKFDTKFILRVEANEVNLSTNELSLTMKKFFKDLFVDGLEFPINIELGRANTVLIDSKAVDFLIDFTKKLLSNIIPDLAKLPPVTSKDLMGSSSSREASSSRNFPGIPEASRMPYAPNFGVPSYGQQPPSAPNPFGVGQSDLDPFGAGPGMLPSHPGMRPGGGMFVGPDHPMFSGGGIGGPSFGPMGGGRGSFHPPGARFDPVMPFGPGSGNGMPRRPNGGQFSGDPDNDELPPPGYYDRFI